MRKTLIAAIVASALFAVGAFAANLSVTSGDISSGNDDVISCADRALVDFTTVADFTEGTSGATLDFVVETVTVTFVDGTGTTVTGDCNGDSADLAIDVGATEWEDFEAVTVSTTPPGTATFGSSATPLGVPVNDIVNVSVLVNGAAVDATVV